MTDYGAWARGGLVLPGREDWCGPFRLDRIYQGDCLKMLRYVPTGSVDLIIADPPYGIGYASSRRTRMDGSPRKTTPDFGRDVYDGRWLVEARRILKPSGAMYVFTRWDVLGIWKADIEAAGLTVVQRLVWDKKHWGMGDLRYWGSQTEDILFCVQSFEHKMSWPQRRGNLLQINKMLIPEGQYDHPTQKPEQLIAPFIEYSSPPGGVVVDPFVGSGTTSRVAQALGRRYLCFDINPVFCEMARERVKLESLPMFDVSLRQQQLALPEVAA